jgi:hypothetical protein
MNQSKNRSPRAAQRKAEADAMFAFYNDGPGDLLADEAERTAPKQAHPPLAASSGEFAPDTVVGEPSAAGEEP